MMAAQPDHFRPWLRPGGAGFLCIWAGFLIYGAGWALAAEGPRGTPLLRYGDPVRAGVLEDERIVESSGLAPGRRNPQVLWTHNDSGHPPVLFAIGMGGEARGTFRLSGARPIDWEDIASFRLDGVDYLLVGDVGDNRRRRSHCTLYLVPEPAIDANAAPRTEIPIEAAQTIDFTWEGGPRDCEAIAVDPVERKVYLVDKVPLGQEAGVYVLDLPRGDAPPGRGIARRIALLPIPLVTGMDICPQRRRMILITYGPAHEFYRGEDESWIKAIARPPRRLEMPPRVQGESICYARDGSALYLTSERRPAPLWKVPVLDRPAR